MPEVIEELYRHHTGLLAMSVTLLIGSMWAMQRLIRVFTIRRLTIPAVFYLTYLPMIFFPSFLVYLDRPSPFRDSFILGVVSVLVTIPLGIYVANVMCRFSKKEVADHFERSVCEARPSFHVYVAHVIMVLAALVLVVTYFVEVPTIPLVQMVTSPGDSLALTLAREESFKLLDPRWQTEESTRLFYAFLFLRTLLFPILILITMGYYLHTKERKWLLLFLVTILVGGFYAISTLSRAPISAIFMRIFFLLHLFRGGRLPRRTMVVFVVLMLAFPVLVTTLGYTTGLSLGEGLTAIGIRLSYTPALDLYYYFEIFPADHDYLYGHTLAKPFLQLFGGEYFYIENYVHRYISPHGIESGHANAAFISNLHADFGLAGVFVGGVLMGALMQALQIYLSRRSKTIFNIATYSFLVYAIWALNFGSVTSVLFVNGVVPVFILLWMVRVWVRVCRSAVRWTPGAMPGSGEPAVSAP